MPRLYHFTSATHLPDILREGRLRTTESNVGSPTPELPPYGEHLGPDVVWLVDTPTLEHDHGLSHPPQMLARLQAFGLSPEQVDKKRIRFTLDLPGPHATRWSKWAPAKRMNPTWRRGWVAKVGGYAAAKHWWVSESPIPERYWTEITDMATGEVVDKKEVLSWAATSDR